MHEMSIVQSVVAMVREKAGGRRVRRLTLEIGKISGVLPDAIEFCFELCCRDTVLEGAQLEIREIAGRARCRMCGVEFPLEQPYGHCPCGSVHFEYVAGDRMLLKEMEID